MSSNPDTSPRDRGIERFEIRQDADEAAEVTPNGPWVRHEDHRATLQAREAELEEEREEAKRLADRWKAGMEWKVRQLLAARKLLEERAAGYAEETGIPSSYRDALALLTTLGDEDHPELPDASANRAEAQVAEARAELEGAVSEFCGTEHHVLCSGCPCACHKDGSGPSGASEDWPEEFKKLKKLLLGEEAVDAAAARSFEYYEEGSWDEAQGWERTVWRRNALADLIAAWNAATGHSFSLPDDSAPEQPGSQGEGGR